uniref:Uncharacterized protein n=1 Tax=Arundo donax TaxID=35708 RepID=A0A0A9HGT0_ARUDO
MWLGGARQLAALSRTKGRGLRQQQRARTEHQWRLLVGNLAAAGCHALEWMRATLGCLMEHDEGQEVVPNEARWLKHAHKLAGVRPDYGAK